MKSLFKVGCLLLLLSLLLACENPAKLSYLRPNDVLLAFGDSLTSGVGAADPSSNYPAHLYRLLGRRVVNAGVSGELSAEGATRLPGLLDTHTPRLLLLMHGGNDLLQRRSEQELKENLRRMYEAAHQRSIQVVMIAVPRPGLLIQDAPIYKELADELGIPLLEGELTKLMKTSVYKSDEVHLNGAGYEVLARAIADFLKANGAL